MSGHSFAHHKLTMHLYIWSCLYSAYKLYTGHRLDNPMHGKWLCISLCIYLHLVTGGNVWEVRSVKPNSQQIHTGRHTHTSPHTWTEIFAHHTQTAAPRLPRPPTSLPHTGLLLVPSLFPRGNIIFFPPSPFQIITIGQTFSSFTFFKTFKHISVGKKAGEINFIKSNTAD